MSSPLPLRLCCMAAMAPALSESATQARIKASLPSSTPPSSSTQGTVVNGRDLNKTGQHNFCGAESRLPFDKIQRSKHRLTNLSSHLLNGIERSGRLGTRKSLSLSTHLQNCGVASTLNGDRSTAFQREFLKSLTNGKESMNQPASRNEDRGHENRQEERTCEKSSVVNGKSTPSVKSENVEHKNPIFKNVCGHKGEKNSKNENLTETSEQDLPGTTTDVDQVLDQSIESLRRDASKSQFNLERRTEFLFRRLQRLQGKQLEGHGRQQLSNFVSYQHKNLQTVAKSIKAPISGADLKTELLQSEDVKNLSTAALVNLVRKLQAPKAMSLNQRLATATKAETVIQTTTSILTMDKPVRNESKTVSDHIASNVHHMESVLDSDATESSSGGDSCDEYDGEVIKEKKYQHTPLHRRAEWKWAVERAANASRWTWLQAQVSDLEYRIRQQSEIYKQIRASKGSIVLGDAPSPQNIASRVHQTKVGHRASPVEARITSLEKKNELSPCNISSVLSNVDKQASKITQSLGNCLSPSQSSVKSSTTSPGRSLNGVIDSPLSSTDDTNNSSVLENNPIGHAGDFRMTVDSTEISQVIDTTAHAARCRPLRSYRKRKLLRTFGLHLSNRKAARLSSVKCQCYPPVTPCPMCGGRYNNSQTVDADVMPIQERVSLLDAAFHPVLSFSQETPLPVHFEALLKSGEWQNKPPPKRSKNDMDRRRHKGRVADPTRKANRQLRKNAAAVLLSSKIRSKYENKTVRKGHNTSRKNAVSSRRLNSEIKRRAAQLAMAAIKRRSGRKIKLSELSQSLNGCSQTPVPSPQNKDGILSSSCPSSTLKDLKDAAIRRRRGESAFDINNIVIPYSIAAATRVEKLQYKEIVTPKWRDITKENQLETDSVKSVEPGRQENLDPVEVERELERTNGLVARKRTGESDEEIEDLTDETFTERHLKCEAEEKKRFTAFVQYPARRSRARVDLGVPTPEPASPESVLMNETHLQQVPQSVPTSPDQQLLSLRQEPVLQTPTTPYPQTPTTPYPQTPTTPYPQLLSIMPQGSFFDENIMFRRRSGSVSRRERLSLSSNCDDSTLDGATEIGESVDPWPARTFPLTDDEFEATRVVPPPVLDDKINISVQVEPPPTPCRSDSTPSSSHPCSPLLSSASNSVAGDDPNDPEWTVVNSDRTPKKVAVVLKLSTKR